MKVNFIPTVIIGILIFHLFKYCYLHYSCIWCRTTIIIFGLALTIPAILFTSNYLLYIPYANWFYELHAKPGAEITAGFVTAILGVIYASSKLRPGKLNISILVACTILAVGLLVAPFSKQLLFAVDYTTLSNKWKNGVCLQTSGYTCVPACAATCIRLLGGRQTEQEIAKNAGTTTTGTETWYLARALRKVGYKPKFKYLKSIKNAPIPSIIGVRIGSIGHVVVLLAKDKQEVTIGEPLRGRCCYPWKILQNYYNPDGSCIIIRK